MRTPALTVSISLFVLLAGTPLSAQVFDESFPLERPASEWKVADWTNSKPLKLKELRGKVVLVRWWTGPHCRFCIASSAALNEFHDEFEPKGLRVVAFYHHKSREALSREKVTLNIESLGFEFPVAIDHEWRTLSEWWLDGGLRRFTSVTFLIDRRGIIRHIHPGGQFVKGDKAYDKLREMIERLLAEQV